MKAFSQSPIVIITSFVLLIMCNSCSLVSAWIMSIDEKKTIDAFKSGNYKTRIQRRIGWAGPHYYHCRVKVKQLGGLYYRRIISETFSYKDYEGCVLKYPVHRNDTITVDICKKKSTRINY